MSEISDLPSDAMYSSGMEIDCQCARCGSSIANEDCGECDDGFDGHDCGEDCCCCLYPEDNMPCQYCRGTGRHLFCISSAEWCDANPLPGREEIERGKIEWFTVEGPL